MMSARRQFTKEERLEIYNKYGGRCAYCGCELKLEEMTIDHILPLYRGGTNYPANLNPSCRSCNKYKATYTVEDFRKQLSLILGRLNDSKPTYRIAKRYGLIEENNHEIEFYYEISRKGENI